jgi:Predicted nucleic acid-binding protein, contains PIN domain
MKLLDTTFLIDYLGGDPAVESYLSAHEDSEFATTAINLKEIAVGRALQDGLDHHELRATFEWLDIISFRPQHAIIAGEMEATLRASDDANQDKVESLAADILIAAVAESTGSTVVTRNVNDFALFESVAVESY